jgi:glycosyltransferase involved in cell wall biosynthesis
MAQKSDVLYAASTYLPDVLTAIKLKRRISGSTYVQVVHHLIPSPLRRKGNFISNTLAFIDQRIALSLAKMFADRIIVVNGDLKEALAERGFDPMKIAINYNGVDLEQVALVERHHEMFDCAFVGRIDPNKGIADLIQIIKLAVLQRPKTKFVIIGGGLENNVLWLNDRIKESGLSNNVLVTGRLDDHSDVLRYLKASKTLVFPSREEGFGIVIVEAIACECLPIVWDIPVFASLFQKGVVRINTFDHKRYVDEIVRYCNDEELRGSTIKAGSTLLRTYNWDTIAHRELELLRNSARLNGNSEMLERNGDLSSRESGAA